MPEPSPMVPAAPVPAAPPPSPKVEQPSVLTRADILAIADRAADLASSGLPLDVSGLSGRRFELVLPFGCGGPGEPDAKDAKDAKGVMGWTYDPDKETLRVRIAAVLWEPGEWDRQPEPPAPTEAALVEAGTAESGGTATAQSPSPSSSPTAAPTEPAGPVAEGFWIERPWSSSEVCPARPRDGLHGVSAKPEETVAIARFRAPPAPGRTLEPRRFNLVKRVERTQFQAQQGLRIRLKGRLANVPDGQPVQCLQADGQKRPVCILGASFEELRVENAATSGVVGIWTMAAPKQAE